MLFQAILDGVWLAYSSRLPNFVPHLNNGLNLIFGFENKCLRHCLIFFFTPHGTILQTGPQWRNLYPDESSSLGSSSLPLAAAGIITSAIASRLPDLRISVHQLTQASGNGRRDASWGPGLGIFSRRRGDNNYLYNQTKTFQHPSLQ